MELTNEKIKLTAYAKGGGCSCKIAPAMLEEILQTALPQPFNDALIVGNNTKDDAAVYDLGNGTALISTTDFFTPIVDDAADFGRIAAANAISDVYAMGGRPVMAIAILGWPVEQLPVDVARQVLEGARAVCSEVGIPLAGGHSIVTTEPVFGLAVTGLCDIRHLKQNSTAKEGDLLFLTKPLGSGILSSALKRGVLAEEHYGILVQQLAIVNKAGEALGKIAGVHALTDVTGFGLAGHLVEMAEGSGLSAEIYYSQIKVMDGVKDYMAQRIGPDATFRNWNAYSTKITFEPGVDVMEAFSLLPDPQTNGGLLIAVAEADKAEVIKVLAAHGLERFSEPIGRLVAGSDKTIVVKP